VKGLGKGGDEKIKETRINEGIRARRIRVISEDGEQLGIMSIDDALKITRESDLDLVEVAPDAKPSVCRIMDYGRFKYQQERRDRGSKQRQRSTIIKEIKLRPKIGEHDYQTKLRHAQEFLTKGDKVKITLIFRGREMKHADLGRRILERLAQETGEVSIVEREPRLEGRVVMMVLAPKREYNSINSRAR
jgi:translation initiation factor IF-3